MDAATLFSLLFFLLPLIVATAGVIIGTRKYGQWRRQSYLDTKNALSGRLIATDEQVSYIEAASTDDAFTQKRAVAAREHLNAAFASYGQHFGTDDHHGKPFKSLSVNIGAQLDQVDRHLADASTEPGSLERLKVVGKDFGRELGSLAVASSAKFLEGGITELNRIIAQGRVPGATPVGNPIVASGVTHERPVRSASDQWAAEARKLDAEAKAARAEQKARAAELFGDPRELESPLADLSSFLPGFRFGGAEPEAQPVARNKQADGVLAQAELPED